MFGLVLFCFVFMYTASHGQEGGHHIKGRFNDVSN